MICKPSPHPYHPHHHRPISMLALSDSQAAFESEAIVSKSPQPPPILIIWSDYWFNLLKSIHTLYLPHKKPCFISARQQRTSGGRSKSNNSLAPNSTNTPPSPPRLPLKWQRSLPRALRFFLLRSLYIWSLSDSCLVPIYIWTHLNGHHRKSELMEWPLWGGHWK